ncbi:hypothetical protein [Nonomuraea jiangxiensis]|uniref:Lipoprotein LprG n=1 Tax=Nonomuraea jiangxiensis TaxID=633440 RepID=A0A1G8FWX7_9ACTN|nr:hypothetical protein [Nonomuraea jiangxiensis]SDH86621.1 hypothetical protein SAMN05421869_103457 [Nonomuraea jiangxiensis]
MKRILAGVALAASAALLTAVPAQAASADPVKALRKQFVAGHGVRISETARSLLGGKPNGTTTTTGVYGFGKTGVVAADVRTRVVGGESDKLPAPPRVITVGDSTYAEGGLFSEKLPEGKKWVRYAMAGDPRSGSQPLDVFDPEVLKALVSQAKSSKGGTYRGSIAFGALGRIYGEKVHKELSKVSIGYTLDLNSKGLVTRVRSEYSLDFGLLGKTTSVVDTRFTGWGSKVTIKAPAADTVIDLEEIDDSGTDAEVLQEIPGNSLNSLGGIR